MSISTILGRAVVLAAGSFLVGCGTPPTHPALRAAQLPEFIAVRKVVADVDYQGVFRRIG